MPWLEWLQREITNVFFNMNCDHGDYSTVQEEDSTLAGPLLQLQLPHTHMYILLSLLMNNNKIIMGITLHTK